MPHLCIEKVTLFSTVNFAFKTLRDVVPLVDQVSHEGFTRLQSAYLRGLTDSEIRIGERFSKRIIRILFADLGKDLAELEPCLTDMRFDLSERIRAMD